MSPTAGWIRGSLTNERKHARRTEATGPAIVAGSVWPVRRGRLAEATLLASVPTSQTGPRVRGGAPLPRFGGRTRAVDRPVPLRCDRHDPVQEAAVAYAYHGDRRHRPGPFHPAPLRRTDLARDRSLQR